MSFFCCRSTTKAYFEFLEDEKGTRKARLPNGEVIEVDNTMSYEKWYNKYIKSSPEQLKYEKMLKNKGRDLAQYVKYRDKFKEVGVPKEFIPKDVDTFINLKYNIIESKGQQDYEIFKIRYKILTNKNYNKINKGHQEKHLLWTNSWKTEINKGILKSTFSVNTTLEDIKKSYNQNKGRGIIKIKKNKATVEIINNSNLKALIIENDGNIIETNSYKIHYSNKGVHIVPRMES